MSKWIERKVNYHLQGHLQINPFLELGQRIYQQIVTKFPFFLNFFIKITCL